MLIFKFSAPVFLLSHTSCIRHHPTISLRNCWTLNPSPPKSLPVPNLPPRPPAQSLNQSILSPTQVPIFSHDTVPAFHALRPTHPTTASPLPCPTARPQQGSLLAGSTSSIYTAVYRLMHLWFEIIFLSRVYEYSVWFNSILFCLSFIWF